MTEKIHGYHGILLEVDLTAKKTRKIALSARDARDYIGGRGLGMKLLADRLKKPGLNPLSPENPLMFMPGPFSGFPIPSASRTCIVTKSPRTSPRKSKYPFASTVTYANMGGFIGPEIRFAGYDGIIVTGKAAAPVYLWISDDKVEIRDAGKYWGQRTDAFDRRFTEDLGDRRIRTCYIGPAGENLVSYAAVINTAARAAGRGGAGCIMGSKKLKAIAVRGTRQPEAADHEKFLAVLEEIRKNFRAGFGGGQGYDNWRRYGTASALISASNNGVQAVRNYAEGTFADVDKIAGVAAEQKIWIRDFACFCCPLSCKKAGAVRSGKYAGIVHDGPEYETGTMLGANLLLSDLDALMKAIYDVDDYGLDHISTGNVIGFLMEAYEKKLIDRAFLDGIDLKWGGAEAILEMIRKIALREGVGDLASQGVKALAAKIGGGSEKFAIHSKGHELAAWNVQRSRGRAVSYATASRGACHLNSSSVRGQNDYAAMDSLGLCMFATSGFGKEGIRQLLSAITGFEWTEKDYLQAGERIYNLERAFNCREGFTREDDSVPDRFFEDALTYGPHKGAVLKREEFEKAMSDYYKDRGWDPLTGTPAPDKLKSLGLDFMKA
jgi:aldehyde:ferredoxin oxidoreductase